MRKPSKKIAIIVSTFICIILTVFFFSVRQADNFMQSAAQLASSKLSQVISTRVNVGTVSVKSLSSLEAGKVTIYDKTGAILIQAGRVDVKFSLWQIIVGNLAKSIDEVDIKGPCVNIVKRDDGTWNYRDVISQDQTNNDFSGNIRFIDGKAAVEFDGKKIDFSHVTGNIDFADKQKKRINAKLQQDGTSLNVNGEIGDAVQTFDIKADKLDVLPYLEFIPQDMVPQNFTIKKGLLENIDIVFNLDSSGIIGIQGKTKIADAACKVMNTDIDDINGLVVFNKDDVTVFANAAINQQIVKVHGKVTLQDDPQLFLAVRSDALNFKNVLPEIPVDGNVAFAAQITGTMSDPAIHAFLSAKQVDCYGYQFTALQTEVDLVDDIVYIKNASAGFAGGNVTAEGTFSIKDNSYSGHAVLKNIQCGQLQEYVGGLSGKLSGNIDFTGILGNNNSIKLYGSVSIDDAIYNEIAINKIDAAVSMQGKNVQVSALTISLADGGNIAAAGKITGSSLDLEFYGSNIDLSLLKNYTSIQLSGTADFYGHLSGSINNPYLDLKLVAYDGQVMGQPYHDMRISAAGSMDGVKIEKMTMQNETNEIIHSAQGTIGFTGEKQIDLTINTKNARMENIAEAFFPDQPITGNIDNQVHLTGTVDNIRADGHVLFHEGSYRGVLLTSAEGSYTYASGKIILRNFVVKSPFADMNIDGSIIDNRLDINVSIDPMDFAKIPSLPYQLKGIGSFKGHVGGTFDNIAIEGNIQALQIIFNGEAVTNVTGKCNYQDGILKITEMKCKQADGNISFDSQVNLINGSLSGKLKAEGISAKALTSMVNLPNEYLTGSFSGEVDLNGEISNPGAHLTGKVENGHLKKYPLQEISLDASYENGIVTINRFYGQQNAGKVAARGTWNRHGAVDMEISTEGIDASMLADIMDYNVNVRGTMNAYAKISGTADSPQADVSFEVDNGGVRTTTFDKMTGLLNLQKGIINVRQILMNKGEYKISANGKIPLIALKAAPWEMLAQYDQIDLNISLDNADISVLPLLSKHVEWATGALKGGLKITGTLAHPLFNGTLKMTDGAMKIKESKIPLQSMQMDIVFDREQMKVNDFSGKIGNGTYSLTGSTLITGGGLRDYNFALSIDKIALDSDYYKGPFSAQLKLTEGTIFKRVLPKLAGSIIIDNTTLSFPGVPDNSVSILPDMLIDVDINVGKNVHLYKSMLYDMDIIGNVHFGGTTKHPMPSGEINVIRGRIEYLRTIFKIQEGAAYFNQVGSFLPSIIFKAQANLSQTRIDLSIQGPIGNMEFLLTSEPAMSQEEILKLLTFREAYKQGSDIGSSDLAQLATVGLQMSFFNEIEGFIRDTLKLDEFNIVRDTIYNADGHNTQQGNSDEIYNIEIGKYISNKILLKYSNGVNYDSHKYGVEYDFNNNLSVLNEWDSRSGHKITLEANIKF
ncbi:translocation/assembly module TamB domain-containing protein [Pectinatus frisingensis]|jgi:translocation and assembly module TamB|uniref:translocation/assembly module TamB domain-containing protein n=1 Tax=Pectinatus frisingensis TaxID=865 RepID=UPI0018C7060D|nr:translocation/assembly module TamB domain-containing protein [Pectinatus frisingensis]